MSAKYGLVKHMSRFLSPRLADLHAYVPGEQPQDRQYIKLNTNESPYPPSPRTQSLAKQELDNLHLYPDPDCSKLRGMIANRYGVTAEQVICANGSDDILSYLFQAFCDAQHGVAFPDVTYGFYPVYAALYGIPYRTLALRQDFTVDPAAYAQLDCTILLANPNAQTGLFLSLQDIAGIAAANPDHLLAVDEAYVDFGGESAVELLPTYDNILVIRTFSKSRSLAGGRLGFAIGSPDLILDLNQVKYSTNPYAVNRVTQAAGIGALADEEYYSACCQKIMETREQTRQKLLALGMMVTASQANFLLVRSSVISGQRLYMELKERGILVRHFQDRRIQDWVRITIGMPQQMDRLVLAVSEILQQEEKQ